jgi:hypothetical protein
MFAEFNYKRENVRRHCRAPRTRRLIKRTSLRPKCKPRERIRAIIRANVSNSGGRKAHIELAGKRGAETCVASMFVTPTDSEGEFAKEDFTRKSCP